MTIKAGMLPVPRFGSMRMAGGIDSWVGGDPLVGMLRNHHIYKEMSHINFILTQILPNGTVFAMARNVSVLRVDPVGRLVLPKPIRDQLHLQPGSELEVNVGQGSLTLTVRNEQPGLSRMNGVWVHQGELIADISPGYERAAGVRPHAVGF